MDQNAVPVLGPNGEMVAPANAHFNKPIDFWEIALRLCLRADFTEKAGLSKLIQDARAPTGFDPHAILTWITQRLSPALLRRPHRGEDNQIVQDAFLEVVRSHPNVIQNLYIACLSNEDSLDEGIANTLRRSRIMQRQYALQHVDLPFTPRDTYDGPARATEAARTTLPTTRPLEPAPRFVQRAVGGFGRPLTQTVREPTRGEIRGLFGGNTITETNRHDHVDHGAPFVAPDPTLNPGQPGRTFSLTEIWRQMVNRPPNPENGAPFDPAARGLGPPDQ